MMDFGQFARHLELAAIACRPAIEVALAKVGSHAAVMAAHYIGHQMPGWKPLSEATLYGFRHPYGFWIPGKIELGYTSAPLLRTGHLRDSIRFVVEGLEMAIGSKEKIALWQEMGTINIAGNIPPRPFLAPAMLHALPYAGDVFGELAVRLLTPGRRL